MQQGGERCADNVHVPPLPLMHSLSLSLSLSLGLSPLALSLSHYPWRDSVYFEHDKSQHKHSDTEGEVLCKPRRRRRRRRRGCRADRGLGRLGWGYKSGGSGSICGGVMKSPVDSYIKRGDWITEGMWMTLEQLILGISTSWDTACCLLIAAPPPRKHTHKHTPPLWPAPPPSPPPVHVCSRTHTVQHV